MDTDRGVGGDRDGEDEYGPPSKLDLAWYIHNVVSLDYPKVKRDRPMNGQMQLDPDGELRFYQEAEDDHRDQGFWGPQGRP